MKNRIGLLYTALLINCHHQTHGDNAVSSPTVNLAFMIIQPKIKKSQRIQQDTKNEGNQKESKY